MFLKVFTVHIFAIYFFSFRCHSEHAVCCHVRLCFVLLQFMALLLAAVSVLSGLAIGMECSGMEGFFFYFVTHACFSNVLCMHISVLFYSDLRWADNTGM